jgi:hypothetical protein
MGELKIAYSDKKVTPWGGMKLLKDFIDHLQIFSYLKELNIPQPNSNAGYNPNVLILGFWLSIFTGGNRFSHTDWLRYDTTLQSIFEIDKLPSSSTYNRFFYRFDIEKNAEVFPLLQQWFMNQFDVGKLTIDLDSTVITRYGGQEGSAIGYNPKKKGRKSHHPLMAFVDQTKMVANAWLRAGNTSDLNNYDAFLNETFDVVLKDKEIGLVRADSGFYSDAFLSWFEKRKLNYVIAVKFYENFKYEIGGIKQWSKITRGLDVAQLYFKPESSDHTRRYIIVRKRVDNFPKSGGKLLFDEPTYRYSAYVTNLDLPLDQVYNIYNTRADAENRIKELKHDFGLENFALDKFYATEAAHRFMMVAYNIMALFKHQVLQTSMQLSTLRAYCFALGSWITNHANETTLNISLPSKRRSWMDGLFESIRQSQKPYKYP